MMEIVDNAIMVVVPGAMEAGIGDVLFWGALSFALGVAGTFAFRVNRWLIRAARATPPCTRPGSTAGRRRAWSARSPWRWRCFGTAVLVAEAFDGDGGGRRRHDRRGRPRRSRRRCAAERARPAVRGLSSASADGARALARDDAPRGEPGRLRFQIVGEDGRAVRDFEVEHEKRMHLIVARDDLTGFQHLHPRMDADGNWTTAITFPAGSYRVFADFKHDGENQTLAQDLTVAGTADRQPLPAPAPTATTDDGYEVRLDGPRPAAGEPSRARLRGQPRRRARRGRGLPRGRGPPGRAARGRPRLPARTRPAGDAGGRTGGRRSASRPSSRPRPATACSSSSSTRARSTPPPSRDACADQWPRRRASRMRTGTW